LAPLVQVLVGRVVLRGVQGVEAARVRAVQRALDALPVAGVAGPAVEPAASELEVGGDGRRDGAHGAPAAGARRAPAEDLGERGDVVSGGVSAARATRTLGSGLVRWFASRSPNASPSPSTASASSPNERASATKSGVWRSTP